VDSNGEVSSADYIEVGGSGRADHIPNDRCSADMHYIHNESDGSRGVYICNPREYNFYVHPRDVASGYTPSLTTLECGRSGGCYQACSTLIELDPLGNNSIVKTDTWWAAKTQDYAPSSTAWTFWYGYPSSLYGPNKTVPPFPENFPVIPAVNLHYNYLERGNSSTTIGYAFGSAINPISLLNSNLQVEIMLPASSTVDNGNKVVPFFTPGYSNNVDANFSPAVARCWNGSCSDLDIAEAKRSLSYLFKRAYILRWSGSVYNRPTSLSATNDNASRPGIGNSYNPKILKACSSGLCYDANKTVKYGFTINNYPGDNVTGTGGSLPVAAKFFYYAHPDHMPVRNIIVNWDDGSGRSQYGKYKNNLPQCDPEINMPDLTNGLQGFGGTSGACQNGYRVIYNQYLYNATRPCNGATRNIGGTNYTVPSIPGAACYKPMVVILDNWSLASVYTYEGWIIVYEK
jgi:hypothetical protein